MFLRHLYVLLTMMFVFAIPSTLHSKSNTNEKTQVIEEVDPKLGMVMIRTHFPASWVKQSNPKLEKIGLKSIYKSSDGVIIYETQLRVTAFPSGDPQLDRLMQQRGLIVEPNQSLERIAQTILLQSAKKLGAKLIKSYKVPQILNFHRQEVLNDTWHTQHFDSYATEWDLGNGLRALNLAAQVISRPTRRSLNNSFSRKALIGNSILFRVLSAPEPLFKKARDAYIASIANTELNAVWKNINQQQHLAKMARIESSGKTAVNDSWRRHNEKMSHLKAQARTQKSIGDTYSDILDISHSGYISRGNIKYKGHKNFVSGINERTNISNRNTGTNYSVQAGSKYYWVNPSTGRYLGTDNPLIDPRADNRFKGEWQKFNKVR